ncbi:hypothetical protein ACLOJK_029885 [Asimina triloba]
MRSNAVPSSKQACGKEDILKLELMPSEAPAVVGPHYSTLPITKVVQVSSTTEQPAPHTPSMQLESPIPLPPFGLGNVSSGTTGQVESTKTNIMTTRRWPDLCNYIGSNKSCFCFYSWQISAVTLASNHLSSLHQYGSKRGPKVYMSEETSSNIEQSKLHAADAAALAKAIAAAAKVASDATLQAKLMADEALITWNVSSFSHHLELY